MFLALNLVKSLVVNLAARSTEARAEALKGPADAAAKYLKNLGEPKTAADIARFVQAKMELEKAETEYLKAAEVADAWAGRKAKPSRFVPSYLAGKADAITAAAVVYPYVPQVAAWVQGLIG